MRHEKQLLLEEIKGHIEKHRGAFVIMRYQGLSAPLSYALRREIQKVGGDLEVVRKRVFVKAAEAAGINLDDSKFEGHLALVLAGNDPIETTKVVQRFGENNEKSVEVIGGRIDGQMYDAAQMDALSKLPGKAEMQAQLLAVLEAPLSQTLAVMEAILLSPIYCLENKAKESEEKNQQ
jgi:large subunit ribosomal protein L10